VFSGPVVTPVQRQDRQAAALPVAAHGETPAPDSGGATPALQDAVPGRPGVARTVADATAGAAARMMSTGLGRLDETGALVLDLTGRSSSTSSPSPSPSPSLGSALVQRATAGVPPQPAVVSRAALRPLLQTAPTTAGPADEPWTAHPAHLVVQTSTADDEPVETGTGEPSPSAMPQPAGEQAGSAAPTAPAAAGGPLASLPLDELVRQLFDPLCARLKAELRLDRERAGFLTDLHR
jgi:hypothetical protein